MKYEQEAYDYLLARTPYAGAVVETPRGKAVVKSVSLLKGLVKVLHEDANDTDLVEYSVDDLKLIKNPSKRGREKQAAHSLPETTNVPGTETRDQRLEN